MGCVGVCEWVVCGCVWVRVEGGVRVCGCASECEWVVGVGVGVSVWVRVGARVGGLWLCVGARRPHLGCVGV